MRSEERDANIQHNLLHHAVTKNSNSTTKLCVGFASVFKTYKCKLKRYFI